jgi:hypothetical protein
MPDDEVGRRRVWRGERMPGGRREGQQHALRPDRLVEPGRAPSGNDEARRRAPEQPPDIAEASRAGDEDPLAGRPACLRPCRDHAAHGLASGHQRIAHAREMRHAARPEEAFGAGADAAPLHGDDDVLVAGRRQREATEDEVLGRLQEDSDGVHGGPLKTERCQRKATPPTVKQN